MPQLSSISAKGLQSLSKAVHTGLFGVLLALPLWTDAQPSADATSQIDQALAQATETRIEHRYPDLTKDSYTVDYQLPAATTTLEACPEPVSVDWRGQSLAGRQTPKISCAPLGWQLYVPITLAIHRPVVVSKGSLSRGQRLTAADLHLRTMDIGSLHLGYFDSVEELEGYEVARNLKPGDVITPHMAEPPVMIQRGDRVVIIATSGGLSVRTLGEALRDGRAGHQIPVRNLTSRKVVHAYVKSKGVVEIAVD